MGDEQTGVERSAEDRTQAVPGEAVVLLGLSNWVANMLLPRIWKMIPMLESGLFNPMHNKSIYNYTE